MGPEGYAVATCRPDPRRGRKDHARSGARGEAAHGRREREGIEERRGVRAILQVAGGILRRHVQGCAEAIGATIVPKEMRMRRDEASSTESWSGRPWDELK